MGRISRSRVIVRSRGSVEKDGVLRSGRIVLFVDHAEAGAFRIEDMSSIESAEGDGFHCLTACSMLQTAASGVGLVCFISFSHAHWG